MKKLIVLILGFILVGTTAYFAGAESAKEDNFVTYEEVIKRDKLAIIYIYSDNCTYCREFYPVFQDLSEAFRHKFLFSKVNIYDKKYYPLFRRLRVSGVPAIYVYNPQDQALKQISPYYYTEQRMRKFLADYNMKGKK